LFESLSSGRATRLERIDDDLDATRRGSARGSKGSKAAE
jgi:hypothetical protein